MGKRISQKEFIDDMMKIHYNKYDYSKVEYKTIKTKIKILCPKHGIFEQSPYCHRIGQGCPKCGYDDVIKKRSSTTPNFIKKPKLVHMYKYDYSKVEYINNHTKNKIGCIHHGIFEQRPNAHLQGNGCPKCSYENRPGFYNKTILERDIILANTDSTLYLIKHENLHKIGITTQKIKYRFNKSIEIVSYINDILINSFTKEQKILLTYSQYKEKPKKWNYVGSTEFLNITLEQKNQILQDYFK